MPPAKAPSKAPAATERRRTRSAESVESSQRERGRARTERVSSAKARGERPRSGESMDLADELDLMYEDGLREGQRRGPKPRRPRPPSSSSSRPSSSSRQATPPQRSIGAAFPTPVIGASLERAQGKTLILTFTTIAALAAVARDSIHGTPANPQATTAAYTTNANGTRTYVQVAATSSSGAQLAKAAAPSTKQPVHLRALAGVFVVGTIALVLNEVNPTLGVSMAGILLLDVGLSLVVPASSSSGAPTAAFVDHIGGALFNGSSKVTPAPNAPVRPPTSQGTLV